MKTTCHGCKQDISIMSAKKIELSGVVFKFCDKCYKRIEEFIRTMNQLEE